MDLRSFLECDLSSLSVTTMKQAASKFNSPFAMEEQSEQAREGFIVEEPSVHAGVESKMRSFLSPVTENAQEQTQGKSDK